MICVSTCCAGSGECGESYPLMSISPARWRTCGSFPPGGDGSPAARDAGGSGRLAVWFTGAAARRSRCAPGRFVLIGLVDRDGTLVVMAAVCALSFIWIQLIAQRHGVGDRPASGTYWAGAGSPGVECACR